MGVYREHPNKVGPGTYTGMASWFGGPQDRGVRPTEGLALFNEGDLEDPTLYLDRWVLPRAQWPNDAGLADSLDPDALYLALPWDYSQLPKNFLRDIRTRVIVEANNKQISCRPMDWGPHYRVDASIDLSPGAMRALGIEHGAEVTYHVPGPTHRTRDPEPYDPGPDYGKEAPPGQQPYRKVGHQGRGPSVLGYGLRFTLPILLGVLLKGGGGGIISWFADLLGDVERDSGGDQPGSWKREEAMRRLDPTRTGDRDVLGPLIDWGVGLINDKLGTHQWGGLIAQGLGRALLTRLERES